METKDETFNGWTNKPTWLVKLWIDNEENTYKDINNLVYRNKSLEDYQIGDKISGYVDEEMLPESTASLSNDLLTWSMACVNWSEIAKAVKEEAKEIL